MPRKKFVPRAAAEFPVMDEPPEGDEPLTSNAMPEKNEDPVVTYPSEEPPPATIPVGLVPTPHPDRSYVRVGLPSGRVLDIPCGSPAEAANTALRLTKASALGSRATVRLPDGADIQVIQPEFVIYHRA